MFKERNITVLQSYTVEKNVTERFSEFEMQEPYTPNTQHSTLNTKH